MIVSACMVILDKFRRVTPISMEKTVFFFYYVADDVNKHTRR